MNNAAPKSALVRAGCLMACFIVIIVQRAPFWNVPIMNPDEAIWMTCGECIKAGMLPYRDFLEIKPPGIFYLYALSAWITPWSTVAIHVLGTVSHCITAILLARIGEEVQRPWAGYLAAWMFSLACSACIPLDFQASESEIFLILASTAGMWAAVRLLNGGSAAWACFWGFCGFVGFSFKQPASLDFIFMAGGLAALTVFGKLQWRRLVSATIAGLLGGLVPLALLLFYYQRLGILQDCLDAVYFIPRSVYKVPEDSFWTVLDCWFQLVRIHPLVYGGGPLVALASLLISPSWLTADRFRLALFMACCWNFGSEFGAHLGGHPFAHYFIQTLPPNCLVLGMVLAGSKSSQELDDQRYLLLQRLGIAMIAAACTLPGFVAYVYPAVRGEPIDAGSDMPRVGEAIAQLTEPEDRVGMWGFAPQVYYFARRLPACRDLVAGPMSGWNPYAQTEGAADRVVPSLRIKGLEDFKRQKPKVFLDLSNAGYVGLDTFPELEAYIKENYRIVRKFEVEWWGNKPGQFLLWARMTP